MERKRNPFILGCQPVPSHQHYQLVSPLGSRPRDRDMSLQPVSRQSTRTSQETRQEKHEICPNAQHVTQASRAADGLGRAMRVAGVSSPRLPGSR